MPIGPDIVDHPSDVVDSFNPKSFEDEVKELANSMIKYIDMHLVDEKPSHKSKRVTMDLWGINTIGNDKVFSAASELVKRSYVDVGWSKMEIALSTDRSDVCTRIRLYK